MRASNRTTATLLPAALTAMLVLLAGADAAADWPEFRGPRRDGVSRETGLMSRWPDGGPPELWRVPLGEGYSAIAAVDGRLYTLIARDDRELAVALDAATGKQLWQVELGKRWKDMMGNGPRSTPTVADGVVYALGAHGDLVAIDAVSGEQLWRRDLRESLGARPPTWGVATSPLVEGDLLLLDAGGSEDHSIVALDRATGELVWHAETDKAGYAAPLPVTIDGRRQIVLFTATKVVSVTPDGRVLWKRPWKTAYDVNAATPIFVPPNRLFLSSGYATGGALLQIEHDGEETALREVWSNGRMRNQFSSSVYQEGYLYGFDNATFKCLDATTGEEKWAVREGLGHGSLLLAEGHLYVLGDRGKLMLVEATPEAFRSKGEVEVLDGKCWTMPTLADGRLYLRNEEELVALDVREESDESE